MTHTLTLVSQTSELVKLATWIEDKLPTEINKTNKSHILLTTHEIATNAIIHGNKSEVDKEVTIEIKIYIDKIIINITDEGLGNFTLPTKEEAKVMNNLVENGRGLKLAVRLATSVSKIKNSVKITYNTK
ncbi:MAG: ATP-binding protein [Campylobacterota bacterium]|nr:ATP-binding protein [Campylobacterota bacterium]